MPWVLKKNAPEFDVVDGPMAGKQFRKGITYADVPPGDKAKFEEVKATTNNTNDRVEEVKATPKPAAAVQAPAKKKETFDGVAEVPVKTKGGTDK